jgi:hypothetical protein
LPEYLPKKSFREEYVTVKSKRVFQIFVLLVMLFSVVGSSQPVRAEAADPIINDRDLSFWDATYFGYVNASLYEKWHFSFTATHTFTITVTPFAGDLVPLLILLNGSDAELVRGTGTLTSTQSAGDYSIQVQPESGAGFYMLTIREIISSQASVSTSVNPGSVNVGESALVTVSLNNIPAGGYTSAEFTCTYNSAVVQIGNIAVTNLFGPDPAVAINDPQNGSFIVAIAGSNGNKATVSGPAFTFSATGLQAGQTAIDCTARISKGDNILTNLPSTGAASLTIIDDGTITPTFTPTVTGTQPTSTFTDTPTATGTQPTPTFTDTPTATGTQPTPTFTDTPTATGTQPTATFTDTPTPTDTPTSTVTVTATPTTQPPGTLNGQVIACRRVTVKLGDVTEFADPPNGTFTFTALAGTYPVEAKADGFLRAAGSATITSGGTTTMPTITLMAGDINGENGSNLADDVINQWDAMTIGMNYNGAQPPAADLNCDGIINVLDLELLAANYRKTGPTVWNVSYP